MTLLDLQGMETPTASTEAASAAPAGSGLTVATCASITPSNISLALCH